MEKKSQIVYVGEGAGHIEIDIEDLEKQLVDLGMDSSFIKQKNYINLYMAKLIVEKYNFGRMLRKEEKRGLIQTIAASSYFDKYESKRLDLLVQRLIECRFNEQEAYAIIINFGVNGRVINERGCSFGNLLRNDKRAFQIITEYAERVEKSVSMFTVIVAASDYLTEVEQQQLENELGISSHKKDIRHIYVAKRMIEEYMANQLLDNREKASLIFKLLQLKFNTKGRGERRKTEKRFKKCLDFEIKSRRKLEDKKRKSNINYNQDLINRLEKEYGISQKFLERRSSENIVVAEEIVNATDFGIELTVQEKRALIQEILKQSSLDIRKKCYLGEVVNRLQECGFNKQEAHAIIINLVLNGRVINETGCSFRDLVSNNKEAFRKLKDYSERVEKSVNMFNVIVAASDYLTEEEQQQLKNEFATSFVKNGEDVRHIYVAKRMVEAYMSNRLFGDEEKFSLIVKLSKLKFNTKGQAEKRKTEKRFRKVLGFEADSRNESENIAEERDLINRIEMLYGINRDFLEQKSSANIAAAEEIVNGIDFGREVTVEAKRALLIGLLNYKMSGKKMDNELYKMMNKFKQMEFSNQETYGIIINLFLHGITFGSTTFEYRELLNSNKNRAWRTIEEQKATIKTSVIIGPVTMKKLMGTAERVMKKAVTTIERTGELGTQNTTREGLNNLVQKTYDQKQASPTEDKTP